MNKNLRDLWEEAERTGEAVDIGNIVVCDVCDDDYTLSPKSGGFIFGSYAYCPGCAVRRLPVIRGYNEEHFIRAACPDDKSFADFVREYRGPEGSKVRVTSMDPKI